MANTAAPAPSVAPPDLALFLKASGVSAPTLRRAAGGVVFRQGAEANSVFYVESGSVKLAVLSPTGKEAVVAMLERGDFLGEGCLAGQHVRSKLVRIDARRTGSGWRIPGHCARQPVRHVMRSLRPFDRRCSLRPWVYRVAHNTAASHVARTLPFRRHTLVTIEELDEVSTGTRLDEAVDRGLALQRLYVLVQRLDPLDRQVMVSYLDGMEFSQPTGAMTSSWSGARQSACG